MKTNEGGAEQLPHPEALKFLRAKNGQEKQEECCPNCGSAIEKK